MRVHDIMTRPAHVVRTDAPVETAAEVMTVYGVTALPVLDAAGHLAGMVSDSDLLWHRVPAEPQSDPGHHPDALVHPGCRPTTVAEVMSGYPVTVAPGADVADAAQLMLEHDVRSLPVLDGDEVTGVVSRRDIVRVMVRDDHVLTLDAQRRLDDYAGRRGRWTAVTEAGVVTVTGEFANQQQRAVVDLLVRTIPGVAEVRLSAEPAGDDEPNGIVTPEAVVLS